jgi:hypothetical protein
MADKKNVEPEVEPEAESMDEGSDIDMDDEIEGMDMGLDLGAVLTTEDGDTVCSALLDINNTVGEVARQLATANKILVKMLSKLK